MYDDIGDALISTHARILDVMCSLAIVRTKLKSLLYYE